MKLFTPYMSWRAILNVIRVLLSGQLAEGKWVKKFEEAFAERFNFDEVVSVNSGTSALELAYHLAGFKPGDEVIVPVLTCAATNVPLKRMGVNIVFADIDKDLNISVDDVKNKITPATKGIVFVHFGGNNRGLLELIELGERHGLRVIEDAAQAVGSDVWGLADFTCVSLQAIKTLTAGDGGVLICRDSRDSERARKLRWFGIDRVRKQREGDVDFYEAGWKFHMNNISAAIALGNLHSIDKVIEKRWSLKPIFESYGLRWNPWLVAGYADVGMAEAWFRDHGIEVGQHHYRNDKYTVFGGRQNLRMMNRLEDYYFFVPSHHKITKSQAHKIGEVYRSLLMYGIQ